MKNNVIVLIREYPVEYAGTKRVQHLLEYLQEMGNLIMVLSLRSTSFCKYESGYNNAIKYKRIGTGLKPGLKNLFSILNLYVITFHTIIRLKRKNYKNILYHYSAINIENFAFIFFARMIGYKIVLDICEDYSDFNDKVKFISQIKVWTLKKFEIFNILLSDAIIVISTKLQEKYRNINAKRLTFIPITAKNFSNSLNKKERNTPFIITYAGSFGQKDNIDLIIHGFIEFNKIYKDSLLYLIGFGRQQEIYSEKYKSNNKIIFTGFLSDEEYYKTLQKSNVLCMCRTDNSFANSGFPFKLGEYLATGNPVIATKVSDVELFLTNNDAYLIDPDNKTQFQDTLKVIYENPEHALIIGDNGKKVCLEKFSTQTNGQILLNLLNSLK